MGYKFFTIILLSCFSAVSQEFRPCNQFEDYEPIWSADGGKIIFNSSRASHPTQNIFVMNSDGSNIKQLTFEKQGYGAGFASPSKNGSHIAFISERDGNREVYLMDFDGSNVKRITKNSFWDGERVGWAPDSKSFLFHSNRSGLTQLYRYSLKKNTITRFTDHDFSERWASYSPDGRHIVFESGKDGNVEIYSMNVQSKEVFRLTDHWADDGGPSWHPNGQDVYFYSNRDDCKYDLYVVNVNNKVTKRITKAHNWDLDATLSPDGAQMVWHSDRNDHYGIMTANKDGSNQKRLTNIETSDFYNYVIENSFDVALGIAEKTKKSLDNDKKLFLENELTDLAYKKVLLNKYEEAIKIAKFAVEQSEFSKAYAYSDLAKILKLGFKKAPLDQSSYFDLVAQGNYTRVIQEYQISKSIDKNWLLFDSYDSRIMIALIWRQFHSREMYTEAIELYRIILNYYPKNFMAYHDMANSYLKLGNTTLAIKFHEKTRELDPDGWYGKDSAKALQGL